MTNDDDIILARLAALPDLPLEPRAVAAVRRRARAALAEERDGGRLAHLGRIWTGVMLPAVLVAAAVLYAYDSYQFVERTYVASAGG
jgi:hypothetical protein